MQHTFRFADLYKYKEVYEANMDDIKATIEGCGKLISKVQRPISRKNTLAGGAKLDRTFMAFVVG